MSGLFQFRVYHLDFLALRREFVLGHAPGNLEPLGMIGDAYVFITESASSLSHGFDRNRAIAPGGMHLQITFILLRPFRLAGENSARVGQRQKLEPKIRGLLPRWGTFAPAAQQSLEERAHRREFLQ